MDKHLNVLVVEDSEDDAVLLLCEIKKGGYDPTFVRVETAADMLACLNDRTWDIVISDYSLPEFSAPEALKVLQGTGLDLPFIIISGKVEYEVAVECMTAGAHDFVRKGNMVRLVPAIERELNEFSVRKERNAAYIALRESEERFRTIFDSINDAVFIHDMETGAILDVNSTMCKMYGYSREEVDQLDIEALSSDEVPYTQQDALEWMKKAAMGDAQVFEWMAKHKSGHLFWVEVSMKKAVIGLQERLLVVVRDITERKQAEKELRKLNEELEQRVKDRTAALEDKNEELEEMNRAFVGREVRMAELKKQIAEIEKDADPEKK